MSEIKEPKEPSAVGSNLSAGLGLVSNLRVFEVDDGGECVWAVTDGPEKARVISREYLRDSEHPEDYDEPEEITELAMDHKIKIQNEDTGVLEELTCAEWIEREGEGFLATTCW